MLFNPAGNVAITSPCRLKLEGASKLIDLTGAVCLYGRGGVTVGAGTPNPASAIDASAAEIRMVSEEAQVQTQPGISYLADLMTLEAATTAEIASGSSVIVDGPLALSAVDAAVIEPGSTVLADALALTAAGQVRLRDGSNVAVTGDVTLTSTGGAAEIQAGSVVVVGGDLAMSGLSCQIGASADVGVTGTVTLAASGSATASDAQILSGAMLSAADVSQTAEHKAMLSGGATIDAGAGNAHVEAPACVIAGSVIAGTTTGSCLLP